MTSLFSFGFSADNSPLCLMANIDTLQLEIKSNEVKQQYLTSFSLKSNSNLKFYKTAFPSRFSRRKTRARLFFDSENAILKELNDKVLKDKNLATALMNKYKSELFEALESDPLLKNIIVGKYTDYKSSRFAFSESSPEIKLAIQKNYRKVGDEFRKYLVDMQLVSLISDHRGIAASPEFWHLAGFADTADGASVAARMARKSFDDMAVPRVIDFEDISKDVYELVNTIEESRKIIVKNILQQNAESKMLLLKQINNGQYVLSDEVNKILRKTDGKNFENYINNLDVKIQAAFNIKLKRETLMQIKNYYSSQDLFSPGIYVKEAKKVKDMSGHKGFVSVDFAGQGARKRRCLFRAYRE